MNWINFSLITVLYLFLFVVPKEEIEQANSTLIKYQDQEFILYGLEGHGYVHHDLINERKSKGEYAVYIPVYMEAEDYEEGMDIVRTQLVEWNEAMDEVMKLQNALNKLDKEKKRAEDAIQASKEALNNGSEDTDAGY